MSGLAAAAARIPAALLVDSYKSSHFLLYPDDCEEMQAVRLVLESFFLFEMPGPNEKQ